MFCPKCGTQNPENGKFCRACGTGLARVSEALTGKQNNMTPGFAPAQPIQLRDKKGKFVSWESAMVKLFTGLAFIIISIISGISQNGRGWWFFLLIPGFSVIGGAVAQITQLKKNAAGIESDSRFQISENNASLGSADLEHIDQLLRSGKKIEAIKIYRRISGVGLKKAKTAVEQIESGRTFGNLPPQTETQNGGQQKSIYDTGEFAVAPSVTENTTRHLEINDEGETMTLPPNGK